MKSRARINEGGLTINLFFFSVCHISGKTPISTKTRALAKNHLAILGCSLSEIRFITQITSNTSTNHKPHNGIDAKKKRWSQCPYFLLELGVAPSGCHHSPCYPMVPAIAEQSLYTKGTSDGRHETISYDIYIYRLYMKVYDYVNQSEMSWHRTSWYESFTHLQSPKNRCFWGMISIPKTTFSNATDTFDPGCHLAFF